MKSPKHGYKRLTPNGVFSIVLFENYKKNMKTKVTVIL